jgi:hypothetical protein
VLSPDEQLAEQFYSWELRGRGWQVWDEPVDLEPPFEPFFGHHLEPYDPPDDGRKHTVLSWLFDLAHRAVGGGSGKVASGSKPPTQPSDAGPDVWESPGELVELRLAFPPTLDVGPETAEQFLLTLSRLRHPLSFELVGHHDKVFAQLACESEDVSAVRNAIAAFLPDASVEVQQNGLAAHWTDSEDADEVIAEFGLSREFMLPLATKRKWTVDPLTGIFGALSDVEVGEIALLQVLFKPVAHPWAESIFRSVTFADGTPLFVGMRDFVKQAKAKAASPIFAAVIRIACQSKEPGRALELARTLAGAMAAFSDSQGNELIPLDNEEYDLAEHAEDLIQRRCRRSGMLLNASELASFVHLPSAAIRLPKLRGPEARTKAAPQLVLGHMLRLGENVHENQTRAVTLRPDQRARHVHVIGASGTGKSTLLLNLILQDVQRGDGVAVLDPHGDLIDEVLRRIPANRIDDVVLFDPSDEDFPVAFNLLAARSATEKNLLASDLVAVFRRLSTSWGDQMTSVLGNAILAVLENSRGGTITDLRRLLVEPSFRKSYLATVEDPDVVYYWTKEFPLLTGRPQAPVLTRLDQFLRPKPIRYMVSQQQDRLDFANIMDRGRIFLARLSHGAIGEENAHLLGSILVSKFHQIAIGRQRQREEDRRYFWLYIDEFHNFVTPSMASILSGARKYRLGLVLAHQELRQLESQSPDVASAVLANAFTRACFRLGDQDAKKLEGGFSYFEANDLQNLGTGEAICRVERSEFDFNLRTVPIPDVDEPTASAVRDRVMELSRQKYATPRRDVEETLRVARGSESTEAEPVVEPRAERPKKQAPPPKPAEVPLPPVKEQEPKPAPPPTKPLPVAVPVQREPKDLGRGGAEHKYLQQLVKQWAEGMGYRASIEDNVLGGRGVDVALRKGETTIACEITVTTDQEHEVGNLLKCLVAGYQHVVALSPDARRLGRLRKVAEPRIPEADRSRVHFFMPEALFSFLQELEVQQLNKEQTVRGYKVKTSFRTLSEDEERARREAVSQVVAKSMRRIQGGKPKG